MKLNQAQKDALKAGKSMEEVLLMADSGETEQPDAAALAAAAAAAAKPTDKPADTALTLEAATAKIAEMTAAHAELEAKLTASTESFATAQATISELKASAEANKTLTDGMAAALGSYVAKMGTALGQPTDTKAMSASDVLAKHADLSAKFHSAFKAGKQAVSAAAADEDKGQTINASLLTAAKAFTL